MGPSNIGGSNFNQAPRPAGNFNVAPQPPASVEQAPGANIESSYNQPSNPVESQPARVETAPPVPQMLPAAPPSTADPEPEKPAVPVPPVATITSKSTKKDIAELEKVWVDKAKTVITENRYNPYEQAHQVALLVQGYLQARYGKEPSKK